MNEHEYVWEHFKFNADQRLKGFNFFVLLAIFSDGGVFTAIEKQLSPYLLIIIGTFIVVLTIVFWLIDERSRELITLTIPALKQQEKLYSNTSSWLFETDAKNQGKYVRYTSAFKILMISQLLFGLGVCIYAIHRIGW